MFQLFFPAGLALVVFVSQALRLRKTQRQLDDLEAQLRLTEGELYKASAADRLTGALNRELFPVLVEPEIALVGRKSTDGDRLDGIGPTFMLLSISNLAEINRQYDLETGDEVLQETANRIRAVLRDSDFLFRWSGSKFLVFCREADLETGEILGRRVLASVTGCRVRCAGDRHPQVELSGTWLPFSHHPELQLEHQPSLIPAILRNALDYAKVCGGSRMVGLFPIDREAAESHKVLTFYECIGVRFHQRWISAEPDVLRVGRTAEALVAWRASPKRS